MPINDWPLEERPREKLLSQGPEQLSHAELLAIFFRTGIPGHSAIDIARQALQQLGGLRGLLDADLKHFLQIKGIGESKYTQLQAALELGRRYLRETLSREDVLNNTITTRRYLMAKLRHQVHEVFAVLCLDNQNRVIHYQELFHGTINQANVYPRVIVKHALDHNAAALILAHNHPSGDPEPSTADCQLTHDLQKALHYLDIPILDHIIVGDSLTCSMAELGLLLNQKNTKEL